MLLTLAQDATLMEVLLLPSSLYNYMYLLECSRAYAGCFSAACSGAQLQRFCFFSNLWNGRIAIAGR